MAFLQHATASRRSVARTVALFALALGASVATVMAGFDYGKAGDKDHYDGRALTDPGEKQAVQCAIDKIKMMAANDPSPANQQTLKRVAECLEMMLKNGKICAETANAGIKGACLQENPPKCTWSGDAINIQAACISKDEPAFSQLIAVLVHEGIHAIQWADGSGLADTPAQQEWVAYSWEYYMLCRRLMEETLTEEQRKKIQQRKDFVKGQRDNECNTAQTERERAKKAGEKSNPGKSQLVPGVEYFQDLDDSSIILVGDAVTAYQIQTPFDRTFELQVELNPDGTSDLLMVCGVDNSGVTGGVAMYTDNTGDGLADESTLMHFPGLGEPISLGYDAGDPGRRAAIYVLDLGPSAVRVIADADADGMPDLLLPTPFADAGAYPILLDMLALRSSASPGDTPRVTLAPFGDDITVIRSDRVDHELIDLDGNLVADMIQALPRNTEIMAYAPTSLNDVQHGDVQMMVAGLGGHQLQIFVTDPDGNPIQLVGQVFVPPSQGVSAMIVNLSRPLNLGEFFLVVDTSAGMAHDEPTQVHPTGPEIFGTDRMTYYPGETVHVFGRNFSPTSVALVSNMPMPTTFLGSGHLAFQAVNLNNQPTNLFVLEIQSGPLLSQIAGIQFVADCNDNLVDDTVDIANGTSQDTNMNSIPDECESPCPGDTNGDGVVDNADLQAILDGWQATIGAPNYNPNADFNNDGIIDNFDLQVILDYWMRACLLPGPLPPKDD
jgi:catechol 2,3-dioxygenase-like lactoylglutathione lyase family enzyme